MKQADLVDLIKKTGVDGIVFDIQDVGARYYTFIWTMFDMMCAAAATKNSFNFFVLDRPNPLGGETVRGPITARIHIGSRKGCWYTSSAWNDGRGTSKVLQ